METTDKKCENCKYGKQHYYIGFNGLFAKAYNSMHCTNGKITKARFSKHFNDKQACEHWLPFEQQREFVEQQIAAQLLRMNKQLESFLQVIQLIENKSTDNSTKEKAQQLLEQAKSTDE